MLGIIPLTEFDCFFIALGFALWDKETEESLLKNGSSCASETLQIVL